MTRATNSRAARRARCHKHKDEPKIPALVPAPTLPDIYAFAEEEPPELFTSATYRLPSVEPVILSESALGPEAAFGKTTWKRLHHGGTWSFRLGLRWELPGLPWIPQLVRREASYEPETLPLSAAEKERSNRKTRASFAGAIRELREERDLDAEQLAAASGLQLWHLTALEEARVEGISLGAFDAIADAFGLKWSELFRRMEEVGEEAER
jgi:hypothetical protein